MLQMVFFETLTKGIVNRMLSVIAESDYFLGFNKSNSQHFYARALNENNRRRR